MSHNVVDTANSVRQGEELDIASVDAWFKANACNASNASNANEKNISPILLF